MMFLKFFASWIAVADSSRLLPLFGPRDADEFCWISAAYPVVQADFFTTACSLDLHFVPNRWRWQFQRRNKVAYGVRVGGELISVAPRVISQVALSVTSYTIIE